MRRDDRLDAAGRCGDERRLVVGILVGREPCPLTTNGLCLLVGERSIRLDNCSFGRELFGATLDRFFVGVCVKTAASVERLLVIIDVEVLWCLPCWEHPRDSCLLRGQRVLVVFHCVLCAVGQTTLKGCMAKATVASAFSILVSAARTIHQKSREFLCCFLSMNVAPPWSDCFIQEVLTYRVFCGQEMHQQRLSIWLGGICF